MTLIVNLKVDHPIQGDLEKILLGFIDETHNQAIPEIEARHGHKIFTKITRAACLDPPSVSFIFEMSADDVEINNEIIATLSKHWNDIVGNAALPAGADAADRRSFVSSMAMIGGLIGGYGMFATLAGRYLFPSGLTTKDWMFVAELKSIPIGASFSYRSPAGQTISITRLGDKASADDFIALSNICPHLGCQVHWEEQNERFFCPCHNGTFDAEGAPTGGPPYDASQSLLHFPLKIENGLLFIEVPLGGLAQIQHSSVGQAPA